MPYFAANPLLTDAGTELYSERVGGTTGGYAHGMLFRATGLECKILHLKEQIFDGHAQAHEQAPHLARPPPDRCRTDNHIPPMRATAFTAYVLTIMQQGMSPIEERCL